MKFTKKATITALKAIYKAQDRTALFKLYNEITGNHGESNSWNSTMRKFFEPFCTSEKMRRVIYALCETKYLKDNRNYNYDRIHLEFYGDRPRPSLSELNRRQREDAMDMLRRLLTENHGNYTKVPMMGFTHLYFCHPGYGHADYNKVRTCAIDGNEVFCRKICDIADRHLSKAKAA